MTSYAKRDREVIPGLFLKSILSEVEAPAWLYQAARDHAERYDSRHGTGLIPSSAPMMQEIADFWRGYYGLDR